MALLLFESTPVLPQNRGEESPPASPQVQQPPGHSPSGRAILSALIAGETDPERLADCTTGRLKADRAEIIAAVHGRVTEHHRFLVKLHLTQVDALTAAVQQVEQQADEVLGPFREAADRLTTMPGISETVARVIIAEVGVDTAQFPTAGHLVSWAGLCPRLDESAGKRRSTRTRHATPWLKTTLVQAAWAATRKNGSYLQSQFRRLRGRCGPKKAIVAVAASMLTAVYYMLRDEKDYHDLGGRYPRKPRQGAHHSEPPPASAEPWRRGRSEGRLKRGEFRVSYQAS